MYKFNENISLQRVEITMDVNIKEKMKNLFSYVSNALNSIYSRKDKDEYQFLISSIKERLVNIAEILDESEGFENEYYAFLKIKKMIYYVLENIGSIAIEDCVRIFKSFSKFKILIQLKVSCLEGKIPEQVYQTTFDDFILYFRELREDFFLNIYVRPDGFDDVMVDVANILLK